MDEQQNNLNPEADNQMEKEKPGSVPQSSDKKEVQAEPLPKSETKDSLAEVPQNPKPKKEESASQATPNTGNVQKYKTMAIVGYVFPILFFIPLLDDESKNDPFAKFHANQQLVLLLTGVLVNIVGMIIPVLGWFLILPLGTMFVIALAVLGAINASNEKMKKLPLIGEFDILK